MNRLLNLKAAPCFSSGSFSADSTFSSFLSHRNICFSICEWRRRSDPHCITKAPRARKRERETQRERDTERERERERERCGKGRQKAGRRRQERRPSFLPSFGWTGREREEGCQGGNGAPLTFLRHFLLLVSAVAVGQCSGRRR